MIKNGKFNLEGDLWTTIDKDLVAGKEQPVIITDIFLGNNDTPTMSNQVTLSHLLENFIESNTIPNGTLRPEYREEILSFLESIKQIVEDKIQEVNNIPDFNQVVEKKSKKKNKKSKKK